MNIDSDKLLELIRDDLTFVTSEQEKAYEMGEHGSKMFQLGARKYLEKIRDAIHSGQLADKPKYPRKKCPYEDDEKIGIVGYKDGIRARK